MRLSSLPVRDDRDYTAERDLVNHQLRPRSRARGAWAAKLALFLGQLACTSLAGAGLCACGDSVPEGGVTTLASGQRWPMGIAVDATRVYWTNYLGGTVAACGVGGCGKPTTFASGQVHPAGIAVDGANIYWVDHDSGAVMTCAADGCGDKPTTLAPGPGNAVDLAVDSTSMSWTSRLLGTVMELECAVYGALVKFAEHDPMLAAEVQDPVDFMARHARRAKAPEAAPAASPTGGEPPVK